MLSNILLKYIAFYLHLISLSLFNSLSQKFQHLENFLWRLDYLRCCTYIISYFVVKLLLKLPFLLQSDDASKQSNRGFGERETGQGRREKSLPRRKTPFFAAFWTLSGRVTGDALSQKEHFSWRQNVQFRFIYYLSTLRPVVFMLHIHFQNLCKQLYAKIDVVDEERYDYEDKVKKHYKDVSIKPTNKIFSVWTAPGG